MGRGDRPVGFRPARRLRTSAELLRDAGRPLRVRLIDLGLPRALRAGLRRGRTGVRGRADARRRCSRSTPSSRLRASACSTEVLPGVARERPRRADRRDRTTRPAGSPTGRCGSPQGGDVLAPAPPERRGAVRRRARPRRVARARRGGAHRGDVQRRPARRAVRRPARGLPRGRPGASADRLGRRGVPARAGVGQWMELPLWLAGAEAAFIQADVSRAVQRACASGRLPRRSPTHWPGRARPARRWWPRPTGSVPQGCSPRARPSCWAPGAPRVVTALGTKPSPTRAPGTSSVVHGGTTGGVPRGKRPQS